MSLVWFGMWRCHCSLVAERRDEIPTRCPECDVELLAPVDSAPRTDRVVLGYEAADMCGCYEHAGMGVR